MRLAVLVSGSGTNLQALIDTAVGPAGLGGDIVVVGSDRPDAGGLDRARAAGIPAFAEPLDAHPDRATWEKALVARLQEYAPDAVVLAGFMRLVSGDFLAQWPGRVVNTHPSLLPSFRGAHAVEEALEHGVKVTGLTVHFVDEQVDHGPIIAQVAVPVGPDDDADRLHERIKAAEHRLYPWCVRALCRGHLRIQGRHVIVDPAAGPVPTVNQEPSK